MNITLLEDSLGKSGHYTDSEALPTPLFLLGESHGQKSLADYRPQDMTEAT